MGATTHCLRAVCHGGANGWQAICECGWDGPQGRDAQLMRRDYGKHVEAELGPEPSRYEAPVVCINCAYRGPAPLLVGTDVWHGICPRCNVSGRLRPDNEHREAEQRSWSGLWQ